MAEARGLPESSSNRETASLTSTVPLGETPTWRPPSRDVLTPGQSVGRYTVLALVGRGGMSEVYAAYDPSLDRRVALKLIRAERVSGSGTAQDRMFREAQAIAKLSHPSVIVVHDVGTFEDQVFIAMEFVEGETLAAWLKERERSWREIVPLFTQAARGLSAAHAAGLVHRDFKPQNVIVASDGSARVMDFGLARRIDQDGQEGGEHGGDEAGRAPAPPPLDASLTRTGDIIGTPLYMAPEQFASGRVDARTDQFSFCVALHWALYGSHPFGGDEFADLARNVARGVLQPPTRKSGAPAWLYQVLVRGLATDPGARWPSMDALVDALARDPARRRRVVVFGAVAVLACAALALGGARLAARRGQLCLEGPRRLAGVWERGAEGDRAGSQRAAVRAAVLSAGGDASKTWERLSTLLDRRAAEWESTYRDACEATHVRGDQSAEVLDLRMSCLTDDLDSTRALTRLLASGERGVVDHAVEAAASLGDLLRCGAVAQLRSGLRPPRDPRDRQTFAALEEQLKDGNALFAAGQAERAAAMADAVLARSDAPAFCVVRSEAILLKGVAVGDLAPREGAQAMERAVLEGEACGHDRVVAVASALLVQYAAHDDWKAAERAAGLSAAALRRLGGDALAESWLANSVGALRVEQGRWDEARSEFERAIAIKQRTVGPDHPDFGKSLANLAYVLTKLGRVDEALVSLDRALSIYGRWLSDRAIHVGFAYENQGTALLAAGSLDAAEAAYHRALEILGPPPDEESPLRLDSLLGLGKIDLLRGAAGDAVPLLERAVRLGKKGPAASFDVAESEFQLAVALDRTSRDPRRALALAREAVATYPPQTSFEPQRREIERWIAGRAPTR